MKTLLDEYQIKRDAASETIQEIAYIDKIKEDGFFKIEEKEGVF